MTFLPDQTISNSDNTLCLLPELLQRLKQLVTEMTECSK